MDYIELTCTVQPVDPYAEIVMARLSELGYEMFEESETGVKAYITEQHFTDDYKSVMDDLDVEVQYEVKKIPHTNWNAVWESNFEPVVLASSVYIHAAFHEPQPQYPYSIVIHPKMAFGTGHHATTSQVMEEMLKMDWKDKVVMDMGCGTGILAILAYMLGARNITAVDNDPIAAENSYENCKANGADEVVSLHGDASLIKPAYYDVVIANINRNIILNDIAVYTAGLKNEGKLILSGFYTDDIPMIRNAALMNGLEITNETERDRWCCLSLKKK